jgi:hypothetical protein
MRAILLCVTLILTCKLSLGQNTDLPAPSSNIQTLPAGSYVIAMDNTNQLNNSADFNLKAYGLVVHLLNNNAKLKWIIKSGKAKDSSDFSVNASKIKPVSGTALNLDFKAGPFVIFSNDTTGIAALVDGFNSGITNSNDKIKVYKTNASVQVDVRYDMTGFIPKAAILDDGASVSIHTANMEACNIASTNYRITVGTALLTDCYTFASEAHNSNTGPEVDNAISSIHRFVEYGGNFLAQCHAIENYENNVLGRFQSTGGINTINLGAGTNISYGNPDLSYSQYDGAFSISKGGSVRNWSIIGTSINNFHKHARANTDTSVIGASVSKLRSGTGGLVFFLGNHRYDDQLGTLSSINGVRMYMNAFLTPVGIANNCVISDPYIYPLSMKILEFNAAASGSQARVNWKVYQNETVHSFELETSNDGHKFVRTTIIEGSQHTGIWNYSCYQGLPGEIIFFRLKILDKDKTVSYSKIIAINNEGSNDKDFIVVNNPVINDKLSFILLANNREITEIRIVDLLGRIYFIEKIKLEKGKNNLAVLLPSALPNGMYIAEINGSSRKFVQKFIK